MEAWDKWQSFQTHPDFAYVAQTFDSSARFHFLSRVIAGHIETNTKAVRFNVGGPGLLFQPIEEELFVRFKHLNGWDLQPRSAATPQQVALMSQVYIDPLAKQLILEDFKEPRMLLTQGYTLTPGEDGIDQIVVVCYSPEFRYFYDIRDDTKAEVATFPGMEPKPPRLLSAYVERPASQHDPS